MHSGGMFLILVLSRRSLSAVHAGSKKWQNASKLVSVVLVIAGAGLAFIALVGGNGGPRWSGLVIPLSHRALQCGINSRGEKQCRHSMRHANARSSALLGGHFCHRAAIVVTDLCERCMAMQHRTAVRTTEDTMQCPFGLWTGAHLSGMPCQGLMPPRIVMPGAWRTAGAGRGQRVLGSQ